MSRHLKDCPCINCNRPACTDCGIVDWTRRLNGLGPDGRCVHRRACAERQKLNAEKGQLHG